MLYQYIAEQHKQIAIVSEQNEFPLLMERAFLAKNKIQQPALKINLAEFSHGETDLRTVVLKLIADGSEAIFVNANTDSSFISVVKQIRALNYSGVVYGAYLPSSALVLKELGSAANGITFVNMPSTQELLTKSGASLYQEFLERFGSPQSGFAVVPTSFEAFRVLDLAIQSKTDPVQFLKNTKFSSGYVSDFYFDSNGAVQGINFQIQKIVDGQIKILTKG
jgi:ABC-type branched-subunit amino acid transport system substrate-binding protein